MAVFVRNLPLPRPLFLAFGFFFAAVAIFFFSHSAYAVTRTWDGGGVTENWSEDANWSSDTEPVAGDEALFNATSTKNATIDTAVTVGAVTMAAGYTGVITQAAGNTLAVTTASAGAGDFVTSSGTFTGGNSTIEVDDQFTVSGGAFTSTTGTLLIDGGDFTVSSGSFEPSTGNVEFNATNITINVVTSETFNNVDFSVNGGATLTITSGDTIVIGATLTMTDGSVNTGVVEAQGAITQASTYDGGTATIEFTNDATGQTYTINGGTTPVVELDSAADASDSLTFSAAATMSGLTITAGFSGTVPITNGTDAQLTFNNWTQAAGTFNGNAFASLRYDDLAISGGTFNAPTTYTCIGAAGTINVNATQTFNNLTITPNGGQTCTISSGDILTVTGTLSHTEGNLNGGEIRAQGASISQSSTADGGSTIIDFDGAGAQTYTINGGTGAVLRYDAAADASDNLTFAAAGALNGLTTTSGFSGSVAVTNASDFAMTINALTIGGGTVDLDAFASLTMNDFTQTGGVWSSTTTTTFTGSGATIDANSTVTFNAVDVNLNGGQSLTISTNDTVTITGTFTLTNGGVRSASGAVVEAQGNVTVTSTADAEATTPMVLRFGGSATQTFDLDSNTGHINGDISVNKTGGQVNLATAIVMDVASQDLTIIEGTFYTGGQNITVNGTSGTFTVEDGGVFQLQGAETFTLNASQPTLNTGSTVRFVGDGDAGADTYTVTTLKTTYHHLVVNSTDGATDTFQLGAALDVNGNFTLTAGTFTVSGSNHAITLAGNWSNSGTFQAQSGTVTFDPSVSHTVTGATTWFNLTSTEASDDAANTTLTLPSATTQTIGGALTLDGLDASDKLLIVASSGGSAATINFTGSSTFTGDFLTVTDNTATDNSTGVTLPLNPANSTNGGNTIGWFPVTVAGTVYTNEGSTTMGANRTIRLLQNGADTTVTDDTDSSGIYSLDVSSLTINSGDVLTAYLDDETENAVTVTRYSSAGLTGLDLYQNYLIVRHEDAGPITNTNLDTADNADPGGSTNDISSIYTVSGGTLSTATSSNELLVNTGDTYTPGGAIDAAGTVDIDGTLSAAANAISVALNLDNGGTLTHTGILTFDGTTAQSVNAGSGAIGSDVVISNTSAPVSLATNAMNLGSNDLTINSSAILAAAGQNMTASGTYSNNGTLRVRGSETITFTQDTNSGTHEYLGDGDSASDTFTMTDFGGTDYFNLTVATTDTADIVQSGGSKSVAGAMTVSSGTYNANGATTSVTGTTAVSGGTYSASTATQTFTTLNISGGTFTGSSGTADVNGTLTITTGTFTAPSGLLSIQSNFSHAGGTFTHNSGSVTFDANTNHSITGTTWNNFTLIDSVDDATDVTLTVGAGTTQTFEGSLTLDGLDASDRLNIVSSSSPTAATFAFADDSTFTGDFLEVTDNTATDNSSGITLPIAPANSVNGGNTTGWFAASSTGTGSAVSSPNDPGSVIVTSPNGGEAYRPGDTVTVTWASTGTAITYVDLYYSLDNGFTFYEISADTLNDGTEVWTTPPGVQTTEALIKIDGTDLATIVDSDTSDAVFSLLRSAAPQETPVDEEGQPLPGEEGVPAEEQAPISDVSVSVGDYIKGLSFATVYYVDEDLKRRPFWDEQTYYTYHDSFDIVKVVPNEALRLFPLGDPVVPKPGAALVKILSKPEVFHVEETPDALVLHWIPTEELARFLVGTDWRDFIIDVSQVAWPQYTYGDEATQRTLIDISKLKRRLQFVGRMFDR